RAKVYYTPTGTTTASTTVRYIHTDHLGGTNIITDSTGTQIVETLDYYPYGQTRIDNKTGSYAGERNKFAELLHDNLSGLEYAQNRYYNSTRGGFISQDPAFLAVGTPGLDEIILRSRNNRNGSIQEGNTEEEQLQRLQEYLSNPQNLNSYSYAVNNPITFTDPLGEQARPTAPGPLGIFFTAVQILSTTDLARQAKDVISNPNSTAGEKRDLLVDLGKKAAASALLRIANPVEKVGVVILEGLVDTFELADKFIRGEYNQNKDVNNNNVEVKKEQKE
ncbi:MAG: hypothetical protein G01um101456_352, partial [Parcubacteria group bacterium Gr01-1014_56]